MIIYSEMKKITYRAGCTALTGEFNYSRNSLTDSYSDSFGTSGVYTSKM